MILQVSYREGLKIFSVKFISPGLIVMGYHHYGMIMSDSRELFDEKNIFKFFVLFTFNFYSLCFSIFI